MLGENERKRTRLCDILFRSSAAAADCAVYTVSRETLQFNGTHADMQGSEVLFVVCMLTNGQHTNQRVAMSVAARVFAGYKALTIFVEIVSICYSICDHTLYCTLNSRQSSE